MTETKVTASAVVHMEVEVHVTDSWGDTCAVSQVHRQASESAVNAVNNIAHIFTDIGILRAALTALAQQLPDDGLPDNARQLAQDALQATYRSHAPRALRVVPKTVRVGVVTTAQER